MVATPIGNLSDLSDRSRGVLGAVDWVAAEDTRHSGQLLAALGLKKPMHSLHAHNEQSKASLLVARLLAGECAAYVSDAGTPGVSDPGSFLVAEAAAAGVSVVPVPGASSVVTAVSASGLDTRAGFVFLGFLPASGKGRAQMLARLETERLVSVVFEAPHRLLDTLTDLVQRWPARQLVLAKELTKVHERFVRGTAEEVLAQMQANPDWQRGEFVLLLAGADEVQEGEAQQVVSLDRLLHPLLAEVSLSQAVRLVCAMTGLKKKPVYERALQIKGDSDLAS